MVSPLGAANFFFLWDAAKVKRLETLV